MSLKDQISKATDRKIEHLPDIWGGIWVRSLSWKEQRDIETASSKKERNGNVVRDKNGNADVDGEKAIFLTLIAAICDENGEQVFDPKEQDEALAMLQGKSGSVVKEVARKAYKLNGVDIFNEEVEPEGNAQAGSEEKSEKTPLTECL